MATRRTSPGHRDHHQHRSSSERRSSRAHHGRTSDVKTSNNMFANDGSFMDMFKKQNAATEAPEVVVETLPSAGSANGQADSSTSCTTDGRPTTDHGRQALPTRLHRTLPPGATYAAAATTYVGSGGRWKTPYDTSMSAATTSTTASSKATSTSTVAPSGAIRKTFAEDTSTSSTSAVAPKKPSLLSFVGRRRGGKLLPTGVVKKAKMTEEPGQEKGRTDAWSQYMAEVRKYKEMSCEDEGKTRPLVK